MSMILSWLIGAQRIVARVGYAEHRACRACRFSLSLLLFLGMFLATASSVRAENSDKLSPPSPVDHIDARIKQLNETKDIDEQIKLKALELYDKAKKEFQQAERWQAKRQAYDTSAKDASKTIAETRREIELLAVPQKVVIPPDTTLDQLNNLLDEAESEANRLEEELSNAKSEHRTRRQRREDIPRLIRAAKQQLAEIEVQLDSKALTNESPLIQEARDELLRARALTLRNKIAAYESETVEYEATSGLIPLRRELAATKLRVAETKVETYREAVRTRRVQEIERQLAQARRDLEEAPPAARELAARSAKLLDERKYLNKQMVEAVDKHLEKEKTLDQLASQYARIKEQIDAVGPNILGDLINWRGKLPNVKEFRRDVTQWQAEIAQTRFRIFKLEEELAKLDDMDRVVQQLLQSVDTSEDGKAEQYDLLIRYFGGMKKRYLEQLLQEYEDYYTELIELRGVEQQLITDTEKYKRLIDERVVWVRTSLPPDSSILWTTYDGLKWLVSIKTWRQVAQAFNRACLSQPLVWLVVLFVFLPLLCFRWWIRGAVARIGDYAAKGGVQRFMPTANVLMLTILLTLLWPGLLWFLSFSIASSDQATHAANAIAYGLSVVALFAIPIEFLRQVCRRHGLAEIHFGWPANSVTLLRRRLGQFALIGCPWLFISVTFRKLGRELGNVGMDSSLGRLSFVVFLMVVIFFAHRILRPAGSIIREFIAERPDGWLAKTKRVWYVLGVLTPVPLIVLALLGYYYAAWYFAARLMATVWLLVGLLLLGALLLRWVLMIRRRLAIAHATVRRELAQMASEHPANEDGTPVDPKTVEPEVDLSKLNMQTRQLVYGTLAAACVLGVCLIWADVLPAFNILREVTLWHTVVTMGQDTSNVDGESVIRAIEQYRAVTLADLAIALVGGIVTLVLAKNFPGLLEFLLLHHLPMDSGLRHALTTVSRYLIVLVGIFFCFSTLGISWSKVQWLVAGISVGLGFGLQEIFANFVSGLVILFERPMRPGDVVTIGDATGKVSRIQIRATTITDWDRKELVVPNKEFITGRLLNWTLTDKTNRVTINVGVAYGSDPNRVREILLEIAQSHPKVLDSPSPIAIFNEFGASALNFSLRVYLESMVGRLNVIHELHTEIHNRLEREGITIAFPQLDLHVKSFGATKPKSHPDVESADTIANNEASPPEGNKPSPVMEDNPDTAEER